MVPSSIFRTAACVFGALISASATGAQAQRAAEPATSAASSKAAPATPATPSASAASNKPAPATPAAPSKAAPIKPAPTTPAAPGKSAPNAIPPSATPPSAAPSPVNLLPPAPVYCGSFTPFRFRVFAFGKDPDTRASFATDIINKFLGGAVGKFTTRLDPKTKNVRLLLNNELVAIVSPADAAAEKQKSTELLATKWVKLLTVAFEASKAQR